MAAPKVVRWARHKTYRIQFEDAEGKPKVLDTGCMTRVKAEQYLEAWLRGHIPGAGADKEEIDVEAAAELSVANLCDAYFKRKKRVQTASHTGDESQRANLATIRGRIGDRLIVDLLAKDLEELRDELIAEGRKTGTVRRYFSALIAALNWGLEAQIIEKDVHRGILGGFTLPPEGQPDTDFMSHEQRDNVFKYCHILIQTEDFHWRAAGAVCLALGTAARRKSILQLTWDRVNFDAGTIDYRVPGRATSNKKRVILPMSNEVREVLLDLQKISGGGRLVFQHEGTIRRGFERIRDFCNVPWVKFKTLRTTWASLAAQRGVRISLIADVLGDDIETTRKHYAHLHPSHMMEAFQ